MINDLKDLKSLFKLCRSQGVTEIKLNGVEISFGEMPMTQGQIQEQMSSQETDKYANFPQGELTPEQLAFYAVGGLPENDPENKDLN